MGSPIAIKMGEYKDFKVQSRDVGDAAQRRKAVERMVQLFNEKNPQKAVAELRKAAKEAPCGSVCIILGRMALNDAIVSTAKESLSNDKRRVLLAEGVKRALDFFVDGAAGPSCRSVACLRLALGLISDMVLCRDGLGDRAAALKRLEAAFFDPGSLGAAPAVEVDPGELDALPAATPARITKDWPWPSVGRPLEGAFTPWDHFEAAKLLFAACSEKTAEARHIAEERKLVLPDPMGKPVEMLLCAAAHTLPDNLLKTMTEVVDVYFIGVAGGEEFEEEAKGASAKSKRGAAKKKAGRGADEKRLEEVLKTAEARAAKIQAFLGRKLAAGAEAAAAPPAADRLASLLDLTSVDVDAYKRYIEKLPKEGSTRSHYSRDDVPVLLESVGLVRSGVGRVFKALPTTGVGADPSRRWVGEEEFKKLVEHPRSDIARKPPGTRNIVDSLTFGEKAAQEYFSTEDPAKWLFGGTSAAEGTLCDGDLRDYVSVPRDGMPEDRKKELEVLEELHNTPLGELTVKRREELREVKNSLPTHVATHLIKFELERDERSKIVRAGLHSDSREQDEPAETRPAEVEKMHQDGAIQCVYAALLGHAVLDTVAGRTSAEELLAINGALNRAAEIEHQAEKVEKLTEAAVDAFGQDPRHCERIRQGLKPLTRLDETVNMTVFIPLAVQALLGALPPAPEGAGSEAAEAHVLAMKRRMQDTILKFLARLQAAECLAPSAVLLLRFWILAGLGFDKSPEVDRAASEELDAALAALQGGAASLTALPLVDLAALYWVVASLANDEINNPKVLVEVAESAPETPTIDAEALQGKGKGRGVGAVVKFTEQGLERTVAFGLSDDGVVQPAALEGASDSLRPLQDYISSLSNLTSGLWYSRLLLKEEADLKSGALVAAKPLTPQDYETMLDEISMINVLVPKLEKNIPALFKLAEEAVACKAAMVRAAVMLRGAVEGEEGVSLSAAIATANEAVENHFKPYVENHKKRIHLANFLASALQIIEAMHTLIDVKEVIESLKKTARSAGAKALTGKLAAEFHLAEARASVFRGEYYNAVRCIKAMSSGEYVPEPTQDYLELAAGVQAELRLQEEFRDSRIIVMRIADRIVNCAKVLMRMAEIAHGEGSSILHVAQKGSATLWALSELEKWHKQRIYETLEWRTDGELANATVVEVLGSVWEEQIADEAMNLLDDDFVSGGGVAVGTAGGAKAAKKFKKKKKGGAPARTVSKDIEAEEEEEEGAAAAASPEVPAAGGGDGAPAGDDAEEAKLTAALQRAQEEEEAQRAAWAAQRALQVQQAPQAQQREAAEGAPAVEAVSDAAKAPKQRSKQRKKASEEPAPAPAPERPPSPPPGEAPAEPPAAEDDEGWVVATKPRRQQHAAPAEPAERAEPGTPEETRYVSWTGDWRCGVCGTVSDLKSPCHGCELPAPCRDFAIGRCYRPACRRLHAPFDLKAMGDRPAHPPKGLGMAQPHADYIWSKQRRAAAPAVVGAAAAAVAPRSARKVAAVKAPEPLPPMMPPAAPRSPLRLPPLQPPPPPAPVQFGAPPGMAAAPMALPPPVSVQATFHNQPDLSPRPSAAVSPGSAPSAAAAPGADSDDDYANMMASLGVSDPSFIAPAAPAPAGWGPPRPLGADVAAATAAAPGSYAAVVGPLDTVWPAAGETQEDAELKAAMEASLADQGRLEEVRAAAAAAAATQWTSGAPPAPLEPGVAAAGLVNEVGEYNCFLNVVVQCLWHCGDFRAAVMAWPPAVYTADPVVAALRSLFDSLVAFEAQTAAGGAGARAAVNPADLREALAAADTRFATRQMADAGELLEQIFKQVTAACAAAGVPNAADRVFGLRVSEEVACPACSAVTHRRSFTQHWHTAAATALRLLAFSVEGDAGLGALLSALHDQEEKTCDADAGGCGRWCPVLHMLDDRAAPGVFALQLAWESHAEDAADIAATMACLSESVDLADVYKAVPRGTLRYRLRALVAYYGQHYQAFVRPHAGAAAAEDHGEGGWLLVDDAWAAAVGGWEEVVRKCQAGRIQPSVLFYEREL